jgi:hypothetical protein
MKGRTLVLQAPGVLQLMFLWQGRGFNFGSPAICVIYFPSTQLSDSIPALPRQVL